MARVWCMSGCASGGGHLSRLARNAAVAHALQKLCWHGRVAGSLPASSSRPSGAQQSGRRAAAVSQDDQQLQPRADAREECRCVRAAPAPLPPCPLPPLPSAPHCPLPPTHGPTAQRRAGRGRRTRTGRDRSGTPAHGPADPTVSARHQARHVTHDTPQGHPHTVVPGSRASSPRRRSEP